MESQTSPVAHSGSATSSYKKPPTDLLHVRAKSIGKGQASLQDRIIEDHQELIQLVEILRTQGYVIALVMGVWDLFHIGHAEYIQRGKEETQKLYPGKDVLVVVAVDTDALTRERKGPNRPIVPEEERIRILGHLRSVDILTFERNLKELPTILPHETRIISESTNDLKNIEDHAQYCEHIVRLPPQAETSTTARVRKLALDGKLELFARVRALVEGFLKELGDELNT